MNDDYLWNRSGNSDPEVERLEGLLARYRHDSPPPELDSIEAEGELSAVVPFYRRRWVQLSAAAILMFFIGGSMAMVIRAELFVPGMQLVEPNFFNQMTTMHALIMFIVEKVQPCWPGAICFRRWISQRS